MITIVAHGITITFKAFVGCGLFIQALLGWLNSPAAPPAGSHPIVCPSWGCNGYPWPQPPIQQKPIVCPSWGCDGTPWPIRRLP